MPLLRADASAVEQEFLCAGTVQIFADHFIHVLLRRGPIFHAEEALQLAFDARRVEASCAIVSSLRFGAFGPQATARVASLALLKAVHLLYKLL